MSVSMSTSKYKSKPKELRPKISFNSIAALLAVAILLGFFIGTSEPEAKKSGIDVLPTETDKLNTLAKEETIETAWQWNTSPDAKYTVQQASELDTLVNQPTQHPFTQESVYNALKSVKLDNNGELIIDNDALKSLNQTFEKLAAVLEPDHLFELQDIIRQGLPGPAGEQVAQITADFYNYLGAQKEFEALYEVENTLASDQDNTLEQQTAQYNELLALQALYLGEDVANKLFATSNANARYMFDSLAIDNNDTLTDEEKKQQHAENIQRHAKGTIAINDWNQRHSHFLTDKQYVLDSSLSHEEKQIQIRQLMNQHFNTEELKLVRHLQLDSF
jgi:lipase chaperone LimK